MGKRRRPGEIFATDVPRIRDWIVYDEVPAEIDEIRRRPEVGRFLDRWSPAAMSLLTCETDIEALSSEDAQLWWVAKSMALLAREAAESIPAWTPGAARPSRHGVVVWATGTGLTVAGGWAHVIGVTWVSTDDGQLILTPLTDDGDGPCGVRVAAPGRDLVARAVPHRRRRPRREVLAA